VKRNRETIYEKSGVARRKYVSIENPSGTANPVKKADFVTTLSASQEVSMVTIVVL
jgi:hypothetical protein